jgi:hypothetical protein
LPETKHTSSRPVSDYHISHKKKPTSTQICPANKNGNIGIFLAFIIFSVGLNNSRTMILFKRFWMKSQAVGRQFTTEVHTSRNS